VIRFGFLASLLMMAASAVAADDLATCILCHGTNTNGNLGVRAPKLSGLEPWYLKRQLELFRSSARGAHPKDVSGGEMRTVALALQADSLDKIAATIATFKEKPPVVTVAGDPARGAKMYATCAACHGANGRGNQALHTPALAKRSDWYLVTQLNNFRDGLRGVETSDLYGGPMRTAAMTLPNAQAIADVVAHINTLR